MKLMVKGFLLAAAVGLVACGYFLGGKSQPGSAAHQVAPMEDSGYRYALDRSGERPSGLVRALYRTSGRPEVGMAAYPANATSKVFHRLEGGDRRSVDPRVGFSNPKQALEAGYRPCQNCFPFVGNLAKASHLLHRANSPDASAMTLTNMMPFSSKKDGLRAHFTLCTRPDCFPN
jgi:hypothetical protein